LEEYKRKLKVLERQCEAVGRSFDNIEKSCWSAGQIFIRNDKKELEERVLQWVPEDASFEEFM